MDFVGAVRHLADDTSSEMSMDTANMGSDLPSSRTWSQPRPQTDDADPASPGGPAPYNASDPFSEPVTTDQEWLDPQGELPKKYQPMPHVQGPDEDVVTLHNARLASYEGKGTRFR